MADYTVLSWLVSKSRWTTRVRFKIQKTLSYFFSKNGLVIESASFSFYNSMEQNKVLAKEHIGFACIFLKQKCESAMNIPPIYKESTIHSSFPWATVAICHDSMLYLHALSMWTIKRYIKINYYAKNELKYSWSLRYIHLKTLVQI